MNKLASEPISEEELQRLVPEIGTEHKPIEERAKDYAQRVHERGIERSHAAWLELVEMSLATAADVEPFICDLIWLTDELDRVFPKARSFVRAGFDEPDEVARLLAAEGGR